MTKPLYFWNGSSFELVGPTTPQSPFAYQTSAPTAPATGDIWIDSDGDVDTYNRQLTRYYFVATAGQTSVSGVDANGLTLAYVAGSEAVYVNGALQVRGVDYTATNGTSITGLSALALNDVVEVFAYTAFTVANAYTKSETDSVAAAAAGLRMVVPSSVSVGSGTGSANAAGFVTFSGASSVSLNGIFSSTYDSYKVVINLTSTSTVANILLRMRTTSDDTTSNYNVQRGKFGSTTIESVRNASDSASYLSWDAINRFSTEILIQNPNIATDTFISSAIQLEARTTEVVSATLNTTRVVTTTQYTGLTIYPNTGNMTGSIAVYGLKD